MSKTHGMRHTHVYNVWRDMRQRCYNKNNPKYPRWGGRGIEVCERWRDSFEAFYEDVSKLPHYGDKGYSLNRIDNDGNYEMNNVEWSTAKVQANNRNTSRYLFYNNETHTIAEWAEIKAIPYRTLHKRLKDGWAVDEAIETPVGGRIHGKKIRCNNKEQTLAQWAKELGVSWGTLWCRIYQYNWPIELALTKESYSGNNQYSKKKG